ncbi:hypothetical protein ROBYS_11370 [Roseobacter sp. OBYS 0001]|nr:hypothetical protein ROBYS_11370 [Roseobacter sp. OBYS 0001]
MFRRKMPHLDVFFQAHHLNCSNAPVPGDDDYVFKQGIADPDVLPFSLNTERSFGR